MASFPEKTMRSTIIFGALWSLLLVVGCQTAPSLPEHQIYMQTEDSHPHEVLPGQVSRFPFWLADRPGYVDVKCTLTGKGVRLGLILSGFEPTGWAAEHKEWVLGPGELQVDIEGIVNEAGNPDVSFNFVNKSQTELLWHQCYNN